MRTTKRLKSGGSRSAFRLRRSNKRRKLSRSSERELSGWSCFAHFANNLARSRFGLRFHEQPDLILGRRSTRIPFASHSDAIFAQASFEKIGKRGVFTAPNNRGRFRRLKVAVCCARVSLDRVRIGGISRRFVERERSGLPNVRKEPFRTRQVGKKHAH